MAWKEREVEGGGRGVGIQAEVVHPLTALGSLSEWFAQASEHNKEAVMTHPGLWGENG